MGNMEECDLELCLTIKCFSRLLRQQVRVCSSVCLLECERECVSKLRGWERKWVWFDLRITRSSMTGSHFSSNQPLASIFQPWCWTSKRLWHLELLLCLPSVWFVFLSMNLPRVCWLCVCVYICVCGPLLSLFDSGDLRYVFKISQPFESMSAAAACLALLR